jgi:radical SAM protein with 4Fe4S-binding SPASM domain
MEFTWKERLGIISSLTIPRIANALKLYFSYFFSIFLKRPFVWGLPLSIAFEPTTSCNLRCPECPSGIRSFTRPTGNADLSDFKILIDKVKTHVFYLTLYFQGEPYLNPAFFDMISHAKKAKIYTVTSTNAHYLNEDNCVKTIRSGLDRLIISLDGIKEETYSKYRIGGDLKKVEEGIRTMVETKRKLNSQTPFIAIQTIAFSHNEHELEEIKSLKEKWGVDYVLIKTAQVYHPEESELLPKNPKLSRYKQIDGAYSLENDLPNRCWRMWSSPVVTQEGQLIPCCFDKDAEHSMGNIVHDDFKETWKNGKYQDFRAQLFKDRKAIDICKNCSEGVKVWN